MYIYISFILYTCKASCWAKHKHTQTFSRTSGGQVVHRDPPRWKRRVAASASSQCRGDLGQRGSGPGVLHLGVKNHL